MTAICTLRNWMQALSPAFFAPRTLISGTEHPSVRGEPAADARPVTLNPGATTWVNKPLGRRVICDSGTLWLCYDGEPQDIVLEPGQTHLCAQRSALSIHALSPSVVRLA